MNNHVDVNVCGVQGLVPCTYKTVVLKPNVIDDKNILTQSMMNKPNTKYVIKYDFLLSDAIVEKTVNVVSTNVSQCGNAAYADALAAYNLAHDAWIDADNAYTNDPNDTTLAAKNAAYAALEAAQLTLNGTPQYYYFAGSAINIKKGQHVTIPEGCVLLNDTRTGIVSFDVAPNDMTVYIGSATTGNYDYKIQGGIVMPANCLIEFDGGSISDGVLIGDETILIFDQEEEVVLKNVELLGDFEYSAGGSGGVDKKDNTDGMGKIYLKKGKPFGEQLTQENTIYVIKYDFDLDGDVTIPANCILEFDGGSISGEHTITGANTGIQAGLVKIFSNNVVIDGTWNVAEAYPEWFGAKGDGITDDIAAIQKASDFLFYFCTNKKLLFTQRYGIGSPIYIRNGNEVRFEGTNRNYITATASMTAMITTDGDFPSPVIMQNLYLDGNNLAEYGIKVQHYLTYTYIINCGFRYFSKYAIYDIRWGCYIDKCSIYFCGNGIYACIANGSVIRDTYFSTITNIGVFVENGMCIDIVDNILDEFGRCAILCSACKNLNIQRNYIENPSQNGFKLHGYNDAFAGDTIYHAAIVATGSADPFNEAGDEYHLARAYPCVGITIKDNFIDWSYANNSFIVIASSMEQSVISNNQSNMTDTCSVLGYVKDGNTCRITDTEISNHRLNKIAAINNFTGDNSYFRNVFSNDENEDSWHGKNLMNDLILYGWTSNSGVLVEQNEQYKGHRVLKATVANIVMLVSGEYNFNGTIYKLDNLPVLSNNDVLECSFYVKTTDDGDFEKHIVCLSGLTDEVFTLSVGQYITVPEIRFAARKYTDTREYQPLCCPAFDLWVSFFPKYIEGTVARATKTPSIIGRFFAADGSNTILSKGVVASPSDITLPAGFKSDFKGLWIIDSATGKPIYYDSSNDSWKDATGTPV